MQIAERARYGGVLLGSFARGAGAEARAHARRAGVPRGATVPLTGPDPLGHHVLGDPERWYRELHASGPVHFNARRRLWVISGFDEVRAAARAHDVLSSAEGITPYRLPTPMLVTTDRPAHARLRRILARDFTKDAVGRLRPRVQRLCDEMIGAIVESPTGAEAYAALAAPLPLTIIADILGVPQDDRRALRRWSDAAVRGFVLTPTPRNAPGLARIIATTAGMFARVSALVEERRRDPQDDALSRLVTYEDDDGALTTAHVLWFCELLLVAGNETTTSLLMALLLSLAEHPDQYEALREDPTLIPAAVEEGLRWSTPIPGFFRTAVAPYEVGHVTIPPGSRVLLSFGAANRDPARFADPNRFDLHRDVGEHLAFGSGIHFCLGAHLARLEATIALETLVAKVARIELLARPRWREHPSLRGVQSLRLRLISGS